MNKHTARFPSYDEAGQDMIKSSTVERDIAWTRKETDYCQAGTQGCSIDHANDHGSCETW